MGQFESRAFFRMGLDRAGRTPHQRFGRLRPSGQFLDARDPGTSNVWMPLATAESCARRGPRILWKRHDVVTRESSQDTPAEVRPSALSPQPGVFGFGLLKDRKVRVGVLP